MLKRFLLTVFVSIAALGLSIQHAEAKRLGGGGSVGMQRSIPQRQASPPPSYQQPGARPAPTAAPQPAQSGWRRWAGPLAGLAAGIGLAALASHFGMSGEFAGILLLIVGVVIVFALIRRMTASRQPELAPAGGTAWQQPAQYEAQQAYGSSAAPVTAANIPADFDVEAFVRTAKVGFNRLQAANDAGNLDDIREFTSPEMFAEIKMGIEERKGATQKTDVMSLNAEVLEVVEEARRYIVSVHFSGMLREEEHSAPINFDEVWHLTKPRDGAGGWTLAGIQQIA